MDHPALGPGVDADLKMAGDEENPTAFRKRRWHRRRDIRFLAVVALYLAIFNGYGYFTGPSRISDRLQQALDTGAARVNIVVTAKFPPEEFHLGIYQDVGAMRGSKGNTSTLFRVKRADVRALARHYWIDRIDLAPPPKL
jgi:hypothetical protein